MAREQELKAAFYSAISRHKTCQENLQTFQNDLKNLMVMFLQCTQDQVKLLNSEGETGEAASFFGDHWAFVLAVDVAGLELQLPIAVSPGLDIETVFIARLRNEATGFQVPHKQHAFIEHIFKTLKHYLDNALFGQKPDDPVKIGF